MLESDEEKMKIRKPTMRIPAKTMVIGFVRRNDLDEAMVMWLWR